MDKIREEFEIIKPKLIEDFLQDKDNVNLMFAGFKACAKSRDDEIKKIKLENRLKYEEIKKLREALKEISTFQYETDSKDAILIAKWAGQALQE